jgi:pimeloyl-ACP methyl ester carboxylesterase
MRTRIIACGVPDAHADRIVLLPGAYHELEQFIGAGFDQALRERRLSAELILAAPELAHLNDRGWLARLRAEVIEPARERGRGTVWLGGISLGGFMALRYAAEAIDGLDGLCLLAPYLGSRLVAAEVAAHRNLASWQAAVLGEHELGEHDDERRIWRFVRSLGAAAAPRVFLGFGREDRFADTQRLLARVLPASSTQEIPGGHDWPVWRRLWELFLDQLAASGGTPPQAQRA